jgi:YgiT-type zinc finger domain-containing protein
MVCDICGQEGAHIIKITETYGDENNPLVIGDIPVIECPHCGESYLTAKTLHKIERIKSRWKANAVACPVEVESMYKNNIGR